jgi:hypothetical protein
MANPRIRFTLGSHVQFGILDFLYTGVDYDLVLLPLPLTSTPSLRPCPAFTRTSTRGRSQRTIGQEVLEADQCGPVSRTAMGKPAASPQLQFTLIHLRERFPWIYRLAMCRLLQNSSRPPRWPLAPAPMKTTAVGPAPTSPVKAHVWFW